MELFDYANFFLVFLLGSAVGSFLSVLIDRLPKNQNIFYGRSHCDSCKKKLTPLELIPVFSYLLLFGKCRKCKASIGARVLLVEILTGALYVALYSYFLWYNMPLLAAGYILIVLSLFIPIFFIDLEKGIIPDELVLALIVIVGAFTLFSPWQNILSHLVAGVGAFLFFFSLFFITKEKGMGFGDVKLSFVLGLFLGLSKIVAAFYIAFLGGAIISLVLIFMGKKKFKKETIPFGPFLILATFISYFWGEQLFGFFMKYLTL